MRKYLTAKSHYFLKKAPSQMVILYAPPIVSLLMILSRYLTVGESTRFCYVIEHVLACHLKCLSFSLFQVQKKLVKLKGRSQNFQIQMRSTSQLAQTSFKSMLAFGDLNSLSANPAKWPNTLKQFVWQFCGVGALRFNIDKVSFRGVFRTLSSICEDFLQK